MEKKINTKKILIIALIILLEIVLIAILLKPNVTQYQYTAGSETVTITVCSSALYKVANVKSGTQKSMKAYVFGIPIADECPNVELP